MPNLKRFVSRYELLTLMIFFSQSSPQIICIFGWIFNHISRFNLLTFSLVNKVTFFPSICPSILCIPFLHITAWTYVSLAGAMGSSTYNLFHGKILSFVEYFLIFLKRKVYLHYGRVMEMVRPYRDVFQFPHLFKCFYPLFNLDILMCTCKNRMPS